jgi:predicted pyridoxine 5'-phosphate oxidase superfamily flavin-nucleotide-binding protein
MDMKEKAEKLRRQVLERGGVGPRALHAGAETGGGGLRAVSTTLQQQGRDVLRFLTVAAQGRLDGTGPPSLLPSDSPLGP